MQDPNGKAFFRPRIGPRIGLNPLRSAAAVCVCLVLAVYTLPVQGQTSGKPTSHSDVCNDPRELRDLTRDEMRAAIEKALAAFAAGAGPDPERAWVRGGGEHGGGSKYRCKAIPDEQQMDRLDFTVFSQQELDAKDLNLRGACLRKSRFTNLKLTNMKLKGANLYGSCLRMTNFNGMDLENTILERADLVLSDLQDTNLDRVALVRSDLQGAFIGGKGVSLEGTVYEPQNVPTLRGMDEIAPELTKLRFNSTTEGLAALRTAVRQGGLHEAERAITYAIESQRLETTAQPEKLFRIILFQLPTQFGLNPGNALWWLVFFWLLFSAIYSVIIQVNCNKLGAVHKFYPDPSKSVEHFAEGSQKPPEQIEPKNLRHTLAWASYFSLISALHIGWRDFNMGEWLIRMNPGDFTLRGTGWVRSLSTLQSVVSVYLVAMWVLTYFGRPFG